MTDVVPSRRCTARNRAGNRCGRVAIPGGTVCYMHGGATPAVKAAAQRRLEKARVDGEIGALLEELEVGDAPDALTALEEVVHRAGRMAQLLGMLMGELTGNSGESVLYGPDHQGDGRPHVLVTMYADWLDRYTRSVKLALDAGIDMRRLQINEATTERLAGALERTIDRLGLAPEVHQRFRLAFGEELRAITAPSDLEEE